MIDELAIPQWMRVMVRLTGRHLRRGTPRRAHRNRARTALRSSDDARARPDPIVETNSIGVRGWDAIRPEPPAHRTTTDDDQLTADFLESARAVSRRNALVAAALSQVTPVVEAARLTADEALDPRIESAEVDANVGEISQARDHLLSSAVDPIVSDDVVSASLPVVVLEEMDVDSEPTESTPAGLAPVPSAPPGVDAEPEPMPAIEAPEAVAAMPEAAVLHDGVAEAVAVEPEVIEEPAIPGDVSAVEGTDENVTIVDETESGPIAAETQETEQRLPTPTDLPPPQPSPGVPGEGESATTPAAADARVADAATAIKSAAATVLAPAVRDEYNRTNIDFRRPMPRPKVRGAVIDFHCHLLAARHAAHWFEAADHYGLFGFCTMSPLEEVVGLIREHGDRLRFIAVPQWGDTSERWVDNWRTRIEAFYNVGSRIAKFHASPGTMIMRGHRLDSPAYAPLFADVKARGMAIMTHIGDPDTWYHGKYDPAKFGVRDEHYRMWEDLLEAHRGTTWIGAHLGGNPEDLPRLQRLLDKFPDLVLDCSATRWMVREISARREPAREFFIRNQDRILFGSDQVSGDDRGFDFLASRFWCHRKLWETAFTGPSPIIDPDVPADAQPTLRGLALPDVVLQKIYHDNPTKLLTKVGMGFEEQ